ncbi:DUF302 domain-containing protein [Oryzomonas rubra]|uniref:DUF302 domain-containing protein n=1 Tax=Oryzomonas rubra TaxID=2509454 RepID=A0A5A9XLV7_9BACT|nr:DUF302 domain-containing protein [Oryzomonas rubra]KAA0894117.1 DUF302 domain-containing protein [Oryzomonas rubra]
MERIIEVHHIALETDADFEDFTKALEQSLGRFDDALLKGIATDPRSVEDRLEKAAGEEGLMLFNVQDHGGLLNLFGTPQKGKQYVLGNPLIAATMTRHDIRAGLYAPLRLFVYAADDGLTRIEYDQPSSLFGQFHHPEVMAVARSLDAKLARLIKKAGLLAAERRAGGSPGTGTQ